MATIHTIGHGNRTAEELVGLLRQAGIRHLVDVRAFPASRRHPHFARAALERTLGDAGMAYFWEGEALGGRRRPQPKSANIALRNPSFRAYADHMGEPAFQVALERLIASAEKTHSAIMCAERLPWQCHRYLIADSLVARGTAVLHIVTANEPLAHKLNALARLEGSVPIYDIGVQADMQQTEPRARKRPGGKRAG